MRKLLEYMTLNDMYVILPNSEVCAKYSANRACLPRYTSKGVELISKEELEGIVMEYVRNRFGQLASHGGAYERLGTR